MTFSVVDKKTDSILTQQKIRCGPQRKRKRMRRYYQSHACMPGATDIGSVPTELLERILNTAYRPVPWPWSDARVVCKDWHQMCRGRRQTRGWYLAYW